ncbi:hypothetical protein CEXT_195221 [Caerostris extrusa]|uniref:Uncharacterized protein n=1 Tax=Caerostris extrusa TaxID=172846 RepID=A0AAV4RI89_CAEEX|nr:hypothetical protein CEXT_195221 [Caerostris extrusa]
MCLPRQLKGEGSFSSQTPMPSHPPSLALQQKTLPLQTTAEFLMILWTRNLSSGSLLELLSTADAIVRLKG